LEVRATTVVVWAVQARLRKSLHKPAKQRLVADVHPQRHLWLLAIAAERPLADQETDDNTAFELRERTHGC
jgi:hypothetical protein